MPLRCDVLLEPINYNEDIMKTEFYDKVDTYDALDYTEKSVNKNKQCRNKRKKKTTKCVFTSKTLLDTTKIKQTAMYHICVDMKPRMDYIANLYVLISLL